MSDILCVTNRLLCAEPFPARIERLAKARPAGIILREKDLPGGAYRKLAMDVLRICNRYRVPCILHGFVKTAMELDCRAIHLPLPLLLRLDQSEKAYFSVIGGSCHSPEEARLAWQNGCTYITAGHVFDTDCKKGIPGRGTAFLREMCGCVPIPVYAIGGITPERMEAVYDAGAAGACVMSGAMACMDAEAYLSEFERSVCRYQKGEYT